MDDDVRDGCSVDDVLLFPEEPPPKELTDPESESRAEQPPVRLP